MGPVTHLTSAAATTTTNEWIVLNGRVITVIDGSG